MAKIIVLMGAPGAGKGTQARLLQERHCLPQISTGDILRAIAETQSPLAAEVREIQRAGKLVSDDLVVRVVEERTAADDCRDGYILDGFPRTTAQAEMLEQLATRQGNDIVAILADVPSDMLEKRMTGRRICPVGGEIYNIYFKPPRIDLRCDVHDAHLDHRADDEPEKIRVRLATYAQQTQPVLDYYNRSARLHRVDGTQSPEEIYPAIEAIVSDRGAVAP